MTTTRTVIVAGVRYRVPRNVQRIDSHRTHGWQVRYNGTAMFSDLVHGSVRKALNAAKADLKQRIDTTPAPTRLATRPQANKTTDLPPGISGPVVRLRPGTKVRECNLLVSLPRFGEKPRRGMIYIGTENTYTAQRFEDALARAMARRAAAESQYRRDATQARRAAS